MTAASLARAFRQMADIKIEAALGIELSIIHFRLYTSGFKQN